MLLLLLLILISWLLLLLLSFFKNNIITINILSGWWEDPANVKYDPSYSCSAFCTTLVTPVLLRNWNEGSQEALLNTFVTLLWKANRCCINIFRIYQLFLVDKIPQKLTNASEFTKCLKSYQMPRKSPNMYLESYQMPDKLAMALKLGNVTRTGWRGRRWNTECPTNHQMPQKLPNASEVTKCLRS